MFAQGVITAAYWSDVLGQQVANVKLTDEKVKLVIPWSEVLEYLYLFPQPDDGGRKRSRGSFDEAAVLYGTEEGGLARRIECLRPKLRHPVDPQRSGTLLLERIAAISSVSSDFWPLGTQLWLKVRGSCPWPVLMWSPSLCRKKDVSQLLAMHKAGHVLVHFYGEHSLMWVKEAELVPLDLDDGAKVHDLKLWGREHHKSHLVEAVLEEVENAIDDCEGEVQRLQEVERRLLMENASGPECAGCHEEGACLACVECERAFHTLCIQPPALKPNDLPEGLWTCTSCGFQNKVGVHCHEAERQLTNEKMGLTPDWIIQAGAFHVFQLEPPTPERPYIKGLLDPCTNSMAAPNIPAEVLYDKQMNGLKLSNSWAGYLVLLNPPYTAAAQWRFVNRAIDEVENDRVPAVLLICRNSTDTAYFQRLRPYPRILLRRVNTRFKDYNKTPIGFGICVFAIAKASSRDLYARFYEAFADMGEPNIPIDKTMMRTDAFRELLERLRQHAEEHFRDHWIQCNTCGKWRILTYLEMVAAKDSEWTCRLLRPPFTSCRTPQTKKEYIGGRYAIIGADGDPWENEIQRSAYSVPRVDAPSVSLTERDILPPIEEGGPSMEAEPIFAEEAIPPEMAAALSTTTEALEKFVKLPARPLKKRILHGQTQALSSIELARQSRIAANRAYLASLHLGPTAMTGGLVDPMGADSSLVLRAARMLADKAAITEARSQVIQASRHWAKTSVSCEREAVRLQAALVANTEDIQAAKSYLADAKAHLGKIEQQMHDRQNQSEALGGALDLAREDSGQSDLEELMGREEVLDHRPDLRTDKKATEAEPISIACQPSTVEQSRREPSDPLQPYSARESEQALPLVTAASDIVSFPPLRHLIGDQSADLIASSQEKVQAQDASVADTEAPQSNGHSLNDIAVASSQVVGSCPTPNVSLEVLEASSNG